MSSPALRIFLSEGDVACPECGYNLRGIGAETCPECRARLRLQLEPIRKPNSRRLWFVVAAGSLCALRGLLGVIELGRLYLTQRSVPYPLGVVVVQTISGILSLLLILFCALGVARIVSKRNRDDAAGAVERLTLWLVFYLLLTSAFSICWTVALFAGLFG